MSALPELRIASPRDAGGIAAIYAPIVERTSISFEVDVPTADEIARRVSATEAHWPWLVVDDGSILGYAYGSQHRIRAAYRWSVDVSVYVAEHARRGGVASRLYRALFAILIQQGFYAAFAGVTLPNEASLGLHRALGFEPVGIYRHVGYKHGSWHDVWWGQRQLLPPAAVVTEPLAFAAIRDRIAHILHD